MKNIQITTYKNTLAWIMDHVELRSVDPYCVKHIQRLVMELLDRGVVKNRASRYLLETSAQAMIVKAQKLKGITWRHVETYLKNSEGVEIDTSKTTSENHLDSSSEK